MQLRGRNAVVTGCNRGIGRAIAQLFAEQGANLWACARIETAEFSSFIQDLARNHAVEIQPLYFDMGDTLQVKEAAKQIIQSKKSIDVLVNNAAIISAEPFMMANEQKMRHMFDVNFFSPFILSQYLVRSMVRRKSGSIINVSSSAAIEGNEGRAAYAASKAAIIAMTKVMAREMGPANVRVNAIAPGLTDTDMMRDSTAADAIADVVGRTALRRVGRPEEIAKAVLFLASDESSYMSGQVLRIDGGM